MWVEFSWTAHFCETFRNALHGTWISSCWSISPNLMSSFHSWDFWSHTNLFIRKVHISESHPIYIFRGQFNSAQSQFKIDDISLSNNHDIHLFSSKSNWLPLYKEDLVNLQHTGRVPSHPRSIRSQNLNIANPEWRYAVWHMQHSSSLSRITVE